LALLQLLAIALVVGGFARLELHVQPEGAGYFYVSTPDGYPVPTILQQGMTVRVKAVPRGCYELAAIEVSSGGETETHRAEEVLVELKDYSTEVTAYFRGYPEERCPYITVPTRRRGIRKARQGPTLPPTSPPGLGLGSPSGPGSQGQEAPLPPRALEPEGRRLARRGGAARPSGPAERL